MTRRGHLRVSSVGMGEVEKGYYFQSRLKHLQDPYISYGRLKPRGTECTKAQRRSLQLTNSIIFFMLDTVQSNN